jgi:hypothetical protein
LSTGIRLYAHANIRFIEGSAEIIEPFNMPDKRTVTFFLDFV